MNRQQTAITPVQQMVSSCTGAVMTSVFVTPLDVVKIRLQAQQKEFIKHKCFLYCNGLMEHLCYCVNGNGNGNGKANGVAILHKHWYKRPGHFNGTLAHPRTMHLKFVRSVPYIRDNMDAFVKIARHEGMSSLWSGLPPTLVMAVPATVVYFTLYDQLRVYLSKKVKVNSQLVYIPAVAGGLARIIAATVISPLELVRTKMQSKKLSYIELNAAVQSQIKSQGIFSLWRGLGPTLLRDVPFSAIYWSVYERLKRQFHQEQNPKFLYSFAFGATSGCVAALITAPFDVIKTHRQIELGDMDVLKVEQKIEPTFRLISQLYHSRGFTALYAGTVPRLIKIAPACAIMISTYEFGKSFFQQYNFPKMIP